MSHSGDEYGWFWYTPKTVMGTSEACIGTVKQQVRVGFLEGQTLHLFIDGNRIGSRPVNLHAGTNTFSWSVHRYFVAPGDVCVGATNIPGRACGSFH